jgi:hypothetical protein
MERPSDMRSLRPVFAQMGERCQGALMDIGESWPRDTASWMCSHRHETPSQALVCAEEELARRAKDEH